MQGEGDRRGRSAAATHESTWSTFLLESKQQPIGTTWEVSTWGSQVKGGQPLPLSLVPTPAPKGLCGCVGEDDGGQRAVPNKFHSSLSHHLTGVNTSMCVLPYREPAKSTDGSLSLWPRPSSSCYFTIAALAMSLVSPKSILFCFKRGIKIRSLCSSSPPNLG